MVTFRSMLAMACSADTFAARYGSSCSDTRCANPDAVVSFPLKLPDSGPIMISSHLFSSSCSQITPCLLVGSIRLLIL